MDNEVPFTEKDLIAASHKDPLWWNERERAAAAANEGLRHLLGPPPNFAEIQTSERRLSDGTLIAGTFYSDGFEITHRRPIPQFGHRFSLIAGSHPYLPEPPSPLRRLSNNIKQRVLDLAQRLWQ